MAPMARSSIGRLGLFELIGELVRHSLEFVNTVPGLEALGRDYDRQVIRFTVRTLVESIGWLINSRNDGEAIDPRGRHIMDQVLAILRNGLGGPAGATDHPLSTGGSEGNG